MGDVVNLNRARKAKARAADRAQAAANRAAFGRTGAERAADAAETATREKALNAVRLSDPAPPSDRR